MWGRYIENVGLVLQFPHLGRIRYQNKLQCCLDMRQRSRHSWFFFSCKGMQPGQPWLPQGEVYHAYRELCNYTLKQEAHISDKSWVGTWSELCDASLKPVMKQPLRRDGANTRNPSGLAPMQLSSIPFCSLCTEKLGCAMNSLWVNFLPQKMRYSCWFSLKKL